MRSNLFFANAVLIASLAFAVVFPAPAGATILAKGVCAPTATAYVVSDQYTATTSTTFKLVQETRVTFTQGGANPSCVIVLFTGSAMTASNEYMQVIAVIDGITECTPPGSVNNTLIADSLLFEARTMNFVCPNVAPGTHFVVIRFKSGGGGNVALAHPTTSVNHR